MTRDEFDALPVGSVVYTRENSFLGKFLAEYTKRDDGWEVTYFDDYLYRPSEQGLTQIKSDEFSDRLLREILLKDEAKDAVQQEVA